MNTEASLNHTTISPRDLHQRLAEGAPSLLIDVRTPGEFAAGHVPGARLAPLDDLDPAEFKRLGQTQAPIYVLCLSGKRAQKAIAKLENGGVGNCVLVEGGTQAWIDAGLPVERSEAAGFPLMRQVQIVVGAISGGGAALALLVHPYFALVPLAMGCGLLFAGLTGTCGLALLLAKMPWNRVKKCCASCASSPGGVA